MVGECVGLRDVGFFVIGFVVGRRVVGLLVGPEVGDTVVGLLVGRRVLGFSVGPRVGIRVGLPLGWCVTVPHTNKSVVYSHTKIHIRSSVCFFRTFFLLFFVPFNKVETKKDRKKNLLMLDVLHLQLPQASQEEIIIAGRFVGMEDV